MIDVSEFRDLGFRASLLILSHPILEVHLPPSTYRPTRRLSPRHAGGLNPLRHLNNLRHFNWLLKLNIAH